MSPFDVRELRPMLVNPYRAKRSTPRPDLLPNFQVFEDPAPPWVPAVVDVLLPRLTRLDDGGYMVVCLILGWCAAGDPVARAEQLLTITKLWVGELAPMLELFITAARKSNAGRAAGSKYRPIAPATVARDWPPVGEQPVTTMKLVPAGGS